MDFSMEEVRQTYTLTITRTITITNQDIDYIMDIALEGGITRWCDEIWVFGEPLGQRASEQISRGGTLMLYPKCGLVDNLTREKFLNGIQQAIEVGYYSAYGWCDANEIDTCNVEAEVADGIVQFALFGAIIY